MALPTKQTKNGMELMMEAMLRPIVAKLVGHPHFDVATDYVVKEWKEFHDRLTNIENLLGQLVLQQGIGSERYSGNGIANHLAEYGDKPNLQNINGD